MTMFKVQLSGGRTVTVADADAYQPEGPMTTFFMVGSSKRTIDSWSVRVASYRTADVVAVERIEAPDTLTLDLRDGADEPLIAA